MAETKQEVFEALLKKYKSASNIREWNNAARGNQYLESKASLDKELTSWSKRYTAGT